LVRLGPARLRRIGTGILAAAILAGSAAEPALAFKLFGRSFFEADDAEVAVVPDAQPYELSFEIEADKELTQALKNASALQRDADRPPPGTAGLIARARGDYGRLLAALYAEGYYGGTISIRVQGVEAETIRPDVELPDPVPVVIAVEPGPLFQFGDIRVEGLPSDPMSGEDRRALNLDDWDFKRGATARSGVILTTEGRLADVWRQRGHPKAEVTSREITADHATRTVDVTLVVTPGPVAAFGMVGVTGTERMDPETVRYLTGIEPGEAYDPDTLERARERLQQVGVFSSVAVVEDPVVGADGILPVTFKVSERKRRVIGGGVSYSTTDGAELQAYWMHRNLFGHAESLRFDASVSRIGAESLEGLNYSFATTFRRPGVLTPNTDLTLLLGAKREFVDAYESRTFTAQAGFEHRFSERLTGKTALNVEKTYTEDAFGENQYLIVSLPSELDYDARDNKLDPTEGLRGTLNIEPLYDVQNGTMALAGRGSISAYRGFGERDRVVLAGRAALGTIVGASLSDIPATRRFYLGGGGSIRGYEYRSVGPRIGDEVIGGLSFWEASAEVRVRVTNTIGLVPFIDFGAAYEDSVPDFSEGIRMGAGIGLRYYTALGPLRFDVAVPLNPEDGDPAVAFYVGLGQAF
jgi:translocation and assembly module TamA